MKTPVVLVILLRILFPRLLCVSMQRRATRHNLVTYSYQIRYASLCRSVLSCAKQVKLDSISPAFALAIKAESIPLLWADDATAMRTISRTAENHSARQRNFDTKHLSNFVIAILRARGAGAEGGSNWQSLYMVYGCSRS
jgi:hypothetical protein